MNNGKILWQLAGVGGGALAGVVTKQVLSLVWKKSLKKPAPKNIHDPEVSLAEALAWTIASGVGVAVAQLVVQRYAVTAVRNKYGDEALPKKLRAATDELGED